MGPHSSLAARLEMVTAFHGITITSLLSSHSLPYQVSLFSFTTLEPDSVDKFECSGMHPLNQSKSVEVFVMLYSNLSIIKYELYMII